MKNVIIIICLMVYVPAVCVLGAELVVPSQYPTIQTAIDAAVNGETVIIAPGTYTGPGNCDIDFNGKAITVRSIDPNDPNIVAATIIDCNGTKAEPHRGFYFHCGEDSNSILDGFTVINGYAEYGGGAIYFSTSNPTLFNCTFSNNVANHYGGAMYFDQSSPKLINCMISENKAVYNSGGGLCLWRSYPIISNCIFTGNSSAGEGGGICLWSSAPIIRCCKIVGNSTYDDRGNGGGIKCWDSNPLILSCVISGNSAVVGGGGIACGYQSSPQIVGCDITGNTAVGYGGGLYVYWWSCPEVHNCILYWNESQIGSEIALYNWGLNPLICTVSYCNIQGGKAGVDVLSSDLKWNDGNIDTDPCFIDAANGNHHLLPESVCINAGDPNYIPEPNETDLDGKPRVIGGRIDMGAYEYPNTLPVADAGPNQVAYAWIDGIAEVTMDGSGSYDADGDELTYLWRWSIDGNDYEANGVSPTIELPVGQHTIELVVNDGWEDSEPNEVVITVVEPIEGSLLVVPRVINQHGQQPNILAILRLPAGIRKQDIDSNSNVLLYPGEIEAISQFILPHNANGSRRVCIFAFFDRDEILEAIGSNGPVQVYVVGQLKTGQYFYGSDTVRIINPARKPPGSWMGWYPPCIRAEK